MALQTAISDGMMLITNADPATRNSISSEFYDQMAAAMATAGNDQAVGAVVITGAGGFFSSGGNINVLSQRLDMDEAGRREGVDKLHAMARAMRHCPKPIIAAVEGGAAGAGLALALACDLIVAADGAKFTASYVRIGLTPDGGTTSYLAQALPRQMVNEMCMLGKPVMASRLYELGLVSKIVEPGLALDAAMTLARELARGPRAALAAIKALAAAGGSNTLDGQLDAEAIHMTNALGSADGREGVTAFLAKRKPDFGSAT
jgi:enoyl-CoA hydratase/carnithine racemase